MSRLHWALCSECGTPLYECGCDEGSDHYEVDGDVCDGCAAEVEYFGWDELE